jgi:O-antigen/teichoic acid export membrane protein
MNMPPETSAPPSRLRLWIARISFTAAGTGLELALRFVRTLFLSHLLTRAEFGVTVAISVVIFTSELVSDIGIGPFVLNKSENASVQVLATAHTLQIVRGLILASGILLSASFVAQFFGVPQFRQSFMLVALVPFIRAFSHLGVKQAQRNYDYRPEAISTIISQLVSLIAAIAAGYLLHDHRAILVAFIVEAIVFTLASHQLTPTPFSAKVDPEVGREALSYGLPLMVSGLAGAIASQVDRMMVGYFFGVEVLAGYGIILTVAMVPLSSVYRIASSIASAMLARDRNAPERLEASYMLTTWAFILLGFGYASGLALGLDVVTPLVFGQAYKVGGAVHLLVSLIAFMRVLRWSATLLLLALGATRRLALATIINGFGLLIGVTLVIVRADLSSVLVGVLIGDFLSYVVFQHTVLERIPAARRAIHISNIMGAISGMTLAVGIFLLPEANWINRQMLAGVLALVAPFIIYGLLRSWKRREEIREPRASFVVAS